MILIKPVTGPLWVMLPYAPNNKRRLEDWCEYPRRTKKIVWTGKYWEVPRSRWYELLPHANRVYVQSTEEKCDTRCQSATGWDCTCSCGGKYHGTLGHAQTKGNWTGTDWLDVGTTTRWSTEWHVFEQAEDQMGESA